MRTEQEVRQMIAELKGIQESSHSPHGRDTAKAIIAALENVLNGPKPTYGDERDWCGCMGPAGCCLCTIRHLAEVPRPVEEVDAKLAARPRFPFHFHGVGKCGGKP